MTSRRTQIPAHILALALAFGVGILMGQQFCLPPAEEPEEVDCPTQEPRLVEYCPPVVVEKDPEPPVDPPPALASEERRRTSTGETLPESPPPATAQQRRLLLGWARDQASTLQGCPRDLGTTYRLAVTLDLDDSGAITEVSINTDRDEINTELTTCLRERIRQWRVPEELRPPQNRVVFRLNL